LPDGRCVTAQHPGLHTGTDTAGQPIPFFNGHRMNAQHRRNSKIPLPRAVRFHTVSSGLVFSSKHCISVTADLTFSSGTGKPPD
jgi:hypothetical protein